MKNIKLAVFDLDGTFLREDKSIPKENMEALRLAMEAGITVAPATGRLMDNMVPELKGLCRYFIMINGAWVYDALEDKTIYSAPFDKSLALSIYEYAESLPCIYDAYIDNHGFMSAAMHAVLADYMPNKAYAESMRIHRTPVPDLIDYIRNNDVTVQKIQYYFQDLNERDRQIQCLNEMYPGLIYPSTSLASNIEINTVDAVKGKGLHALCDYLGIDIEDAAAFGDGTNDLSMIKEAGIGVCMRNGAPECIEAADIVTEKYNDEAGFAGALLSLINYQKTR